MGNWPFIGSAHVVPRWRILGMLGLGFAAGSVVAKLAAPRHGGQCGSYLRPCP